MKLSVPITIADELSDDIIASTAMLDLASGAIHRVEYEDYDAALKGLPCERKDYEFTCGTLSNNGKDVEFGIVVNKTTGQYSVTAEELTEIKQRAAALFSGVPQVQAASEALNKTASKTAIKAASKTGSQTLRRS